MMTTKIKLLFFFWRMIKLLLGYKWKSNCTTTTSLLYYPILILLSYFVFFWFAGRYLVRDTRGEWTLGFQQQLNICLLFTGGYCLLSSTYVQQRKEYRGSYLSLESEPSMWYYFWLSSRKVVGVTRLMAEMSSSDSGLTDLPPLLDQMREKVNREQYVWMGGHHRDCTIFSWSIT